ASAESRSRISANSLPLGQNGSRLFPVYLKRPTSRSTRGHVKLSLILKPDVSARCWFHCARHGENAGRRAWRLVRRLGLVRCRGRELFFAGETRRCRRERFSGDRV